MILSKYLFNEKSLGGEAETQPSNRNVWDHGVHYIVLIMRICFFRSLRSALLLVPVKYGGLNRSPLIQKIIKTQTNGYEKPLHFIMLTDKYLILFSINKEESWSSGRACDGYACSWVGKERWI
jgi:hypothetical protein